MAEQLDVAIRIAAQDLASSALRQAENELSSLSKTATNANSVFSSMAKTVGAGFGLAAGVAGFQGLTQVIGGVGQSVIGLNAKLEQNKVAFTTMLGSAQAADKMLRQLADLAAKTPFEFEDLAEGTKRMLAFGFSAEQVIPMLTAIGDTAAGLGVSGAEGINRIGLALGQMQAKTKVSAEEMLQLTEIGVPAWDILAKGIGHTTAETQQLAEKGLIPATKAIDILVAGMEDRFPNMMEKQSQTFNGLMSTLHDTVTMGLAQMGESIFNASKDALAALVNILSSPDVQTAAKDIGVWVGQMVTVTADAFRSLISQAGPMIDNFKVMANEVQSSLRPALDWLGQTAWPAIQRAAGEAARVFVSDVLPRIIDLATGARDVLGRALEWLRDTGWPAALSAAKTVSDFYEREVKPRIQAVADVISDPLQKALTWLKNEGWPLAQGAAQAFKDFMATEVIPRIADVAGAINDKLQTAIVWLRDEGWPKVTEAASGFRDFIQNEVIPRLNDLYDAIRPKLEGALNWLKDEGFPGAGNAAGEASIKFDGLKDAIQRTADRAGEKGAWDDLAKSNQNVQAAVKDLGDAFSELGTALHTIGELFGLGKQPTDDYANAVGGVKTEFDPLAIIIENAAGSVKSITSYIEYATGVWRSFAGYLKDVYTGFNSIVDAIKNLPNNLPSWLQGMGRAFGIGGGGAGLQNVGLNLQTDFGTVPLGGGGGGGGMSGRQFSPFDDVFRRYAGDLATDDRFIAIVAAGVKAESQFNPNAVGDSGHSVGLFQMHDRGAGAGMGAARSDPNAASSVMVPKYAAAYRRFAGSGLSDAELASLVAATAEMPEGFDNPASSARRGYANAFTQVTSGGLTNAQFMPASLTFAANQDPNTMTDPELQKMWTDALSKSNKVNDPTDGFRRQLNKMARSADEQLTKIGENVGEQWNQAIVDASDQIAKAQDSAAKQIESLQNNRTLELTTRARREALQSSQEAARIDFETRQAAQELSFRNAMEDANVNRSRGVEDASRRFSFNIQGEELGHNRGVEDARLSQSRTRQDAQNQRQFDMQMAKIDRDLARDTARAKSDAERKAIKERADDRKDELQQSFKDAQEELAERRKVEDEDRAIRRKQEDEDRQYRFDEDTKVLKQRREQEDSDRQYRRDQDQKQNDFRADMEKAAADFRQRQAKQTQEFEDGLAQEALQREIARIEQDRDERITQINNALDAKHESILKDADRERAAVLKSFQDRADDLRQEVVDKIPEITGEAQAHLSTFLSEIAAEVERVTGQITAQAANAAAALDRLHRGGGGSAQAESPSVDSGNPGPGFDLSSQESRQEVRDWGAEHGLDLVVSDEGVFDRNSGDVIQGFASGGILNEPVLGRGMWSGRGYSFAEHGPEAFGGIGKGLEIDYDRLAQAMANVQLVVGVDDVHDGLLRKKKRNTTLGLA